MINDVAKVRRLVDTEIVTIQRRSGGKLAANVERRETHATEAGSLMARLNASRQCRRSCAHPGERACVDGTCIFRRSAPHP
jgi:hypothetical protein